MPTAQDIATQQARLDQHRANVATLLQQIAAQGGRAYALPSTINTLAEARAEIARVKAILRDWGVEVADHPDDEAGAAPVALRPGQALHQLRAPVADFVGRDEAVDTLVATLRTGVSGRAAAISGVRGMGGIGKTELAYAVATQLQTDYPDAQLVLELRGASDTPVSPAQVLQRVIGAFQPTEKLPEDLGALQVLYRSVLAGRRVLILADDAKDAAQVRPLQPPVGCALLITSRRHFLLDGMTTLDLDRLNEDAAIQLLRTVCGRLDAAQARQLALLCGCLPLALRISAGILASNPARSVARYLTQLADERQALVALRAPDDPERDVEAALRLSYTVLEPATQQHFRWLGVLAADADLGLVAALLELSPAQAEAALELLLRHSLIEYDAARERWGLHDLVRSFALSLLADAVEERVVRLRYATQVICVVARADQRYQEGGVGVLEGLALFDRKHTHREAVRVWLWAQPFIPEIDALVWNEALATAHIEDLRDPVRAVRVPRWNQAAAVARRRNDRRGEGRALGNLGNVYRDLGEARRAIGYYEQALVIAQEVSDRRGEGIALGNLGSAYRNLGEARRAIGYYEQWLAIAQEVSDRRGEGTALGNLGNAYHTLGETRRAIGYYKQRLAIAREVGDRRGEGIALGNLGNAYRNLGEVRKAIDYHEQALAIAQEVGDRRGEGITLGNLGNAYWLLGEVRRAIGYHEQALAIAQEVGDWRGEGRAMGNLGNVYRDLGEVRKAIDYHEQALAIAQEVGDRRGEGRALGGLGNAYLDLGKIGRAISYYEQTLTLVREVSDQRFEGWTLANRGVAHLPLGGTMAAITDSEEALRLARAVGDQQLEGRVLCDLGVAHALHGQCLEADADYHQSLTLLDQIGHQVDAARTRWAYGQFLIHQGEHERGIALMAECVAYEQRIGHAKADEHAALVAHLRAGGELPNTP